MVSQVCTLPVVSGQSADAPLWTVRARAVRIIRQENFDRELANEAKHKLCSEMDWSRFDRYRAIGATTAGAIAGTESGKTESFASRSASRGSRIESAGRIQRQHL